MDPPPRKKGQVDPLTKGSNINQSGGDMRGKKKSELREGRRYGPRVHAPIRRQSARPQELCPNKREKKALSTHGKTLDKKTRISRSSKKSVPALKRGKKIFLADRHPLKRVGQKGLSATARDLGLFKKAKRKMLMKDKCRSRAE
jgi:hypothetical protein